MNNLRVSFAPSAWIAMMLFDLVFALIGWVLFGDVAQAVIFAFSASAAHWSHEFLHNIGHYIAARRVGYPMRGIRFWGVLAMSIYPKDEGDLPPKVHIQRALGGPMFSGLITLLYALAWIVTGAEGVAGWILLFGVVDGIAVFTLGALMPIGKLTGLPFESDGDTILRNLP